MLYPFIAWLGMPYVVIVAIVLGIISCEPDMKARSLMDTTLEDLGVSAWNKEVSREGNPLPVASFVIMLELWSLPGRCSS